MRLRGNNGRVPLHLKFRSTTENEALARSLEIVGLLQPYSSHKRHHTFMAISHAQSPDPQIENDIVDAIVALDWSSDIVSPPLEIIRSHIRSHHPDLEENEDEVIHLFLDLQKRNRIR